jgi:lipoprotein signal peptidase
VNCETTLWLILRTEQLFYLFINKKMWKNKHFNYLLFFCGSLGSKILLDILLSPYVPHFLYFFM